MSPEAQAYRQEYGFNGIYLLPVNLYGPGDNFNPKSSHVIPALIRKIVEAKKSDAPYIEAWGTGAASREFLYVDDAAEGIILATERYNRQELVNIGSGAEITIIDLTKLVCRLVGYNGEVRWDVTKPDGQPRRRLDVSRAKSVFGFEAKTGLEEGLLRTINWYSQNRHS